MTGDGEGGLTHTPLLVLEDKASQNQNQIDPTHQLPTQNLKGFGHFTHQESHIRWATHPIATSSTCTTYFLPPPILVS